MRANSARSRAETITYITIKLLWQKSRQDDQRCVWHEQPLKRLCTNLASKSQRRADQANPEHSSWFIFVRNTICICVVRFCGRKNLVIHGDDLNWPLLHGARTDERERIGWCDLDGCLLNSEFCLERSCIWMLVQGCLLCIRVNQPTNHRAGLRSLAIKTHDDVHTPVFHVGSSPCFRCRVDRPFPWIKTESFSHVAE